MSSVLVLLDAKSVSDRVRAEQTSQDVRPDGAGIGRPDGP